MTLIVTMVSLRNFKQVFYKQIEPVKVKLHHLFY